ncbi:hypothetical protein PbJCM13498_30590 [Prolixibacter bellariivorans]|uniref:Glycosyl hydrolase n=1 Tax=Prolixibacter bellariivorans TaxID=314319 RepID=A0A5M4B2T0_9BACT|nr:glycoside hydrolase family 2 TIM barrel-domain containing protein [Prolixibacter bellariivorans]GET34196.1 hypothetical protein PbJCM13498_30590 [Prolixibacter bellariivorans]
MRRTYFLLIFLCFNLINLVSAKAQSHEIELDKDWTAKRKADVQVDGTMITSAGYQHTGWIKAVVPGTVLTTLLHNKLIPDPFFGLNNNEIPDIHDVGRGYYTYWFYTEIPELAVKKGEQVWLKFRGINYAANVFLNGKRVNQDTHEGMFLREKYNITGLYHPGEVNRLAVLVEPPLPEGDASRGQGGDGTIARNVTMQCTAGWDWICPMRDRNTGIWDKVSVEVTGPVDVRSPHVVTRVPGRRMPGSKQEPAFVKVSSELENATGDKQTGVLQVAFNGKTYSRKVTLQPYQKTEVGLDEIKVTDPNLWWPNGMGKHPLYTLRVSFVEDGQVSDEQAVNFGIRETGSYFNEKIGARVFLVNGQKVFIKGGNWIASDAMLRLSKERYNAEVRMHAEMNMNMIRVWGGSITERPEFYDACDKYGLLVWQEFWVTGDCNGRWPDPLKKESQARRHAYPDDHSLFLKSAEDQIKMLRNHPSLYLWCGGNEYTPAADINTALRDDVIPKTDGTRLYLEESTGMQLMQNKIGGNGDGPYGILEPDWIFKTKSYPFNPEIGSIGMANIESLRKFIPANDLVSPKGNWIPESWRYHKYIPLHDFPARYGEVKDINDFCRKAQLVSYEQYRALQEGFNFRMWRDYTGMLVWKNQNPWTALRGFFYDYYLDYTGGYFGYKEAAEPVHIQLNLNDSAVCVVNQTPFARSGLTAITTLYSIHGKKLSEQIVKTDADANSVSMLGKVTLPDDNPDEVYFLRLTLKDIDGQQVDENLYWLSKEPKSYAQLNQLKPVSITMEPRKTDDGRYSVRIANPGKETAFFIRLKVMDEKTSELVLPVFFNENYFTLLPGEEREVVLDLSQHFGHVNMEQVRLAAEGWNVPEEKISLP